MNHHLTRSIILLNNSAVELMKDGNYREAVSVLNIGFGEMKTIMQSGELNFQSQDIVECTDNSKSRHTPILSYRILDKDYDGRTFNGENMFTFFECAFTMSHKDLSINYISQSVKYQKQLAAILFYNIGLVHHKTGILKNNSTCLFNALKFYNTASSIIDAGWRSIGIDDIKMLLLSLSNNVGHIQSIFCNFERVETCIESMQIIIENIDHSDILGDEFLAYCHKLTITNFGQCLPVCAPAA